MLSSVNFPSLVDNSLSWKNISLSGLQFDRASLLSLTLFTQKIWATRGHFRGHRGRLVYLERGSHYSAQNRILRTLCGKLVIFLSPRFYVKSILENLKLLKVPFFAILGALYFVYLLNFSLLKVQKVIKIKTQSL